MDIRIRLCGGWEADGGGSPRRLTVDGGNGIPLSEED